MEMNLSNMRKQFCQLVLKRLLAMQYKLSSLVEFKTWDLVPLSLGSHYQEVNGLLI